MFRSGDPALIVKATHDENLMRGVELVRCTTDAVVQYGEHTTHNEKRERIWVVRGRLVLTDRFGLKYESAIGAIPEAHLRPLLGPLAVMQDDLIREVNDTQARKDHG